MFAGFQPAPIEPWPATAADPCNNVVCTTARAGPLAGAQAPPPNPIKMTRIAVSARIMDYSAVYPVPQHDAHGSVDFLGQSAAALDADCAARIR